MKICKVCSLEKQLIEFVKHKECKDGYSNTCKKCKKEQQKIYRIENNNKWTKDYEKTINGFLMRTYRNMKSRILGIQYKKAHLYNNLEILDKKSFYEWSINDIEFNKLYHNWINSNYDRKLTPSIDRINTKKGYLLNNIRWLTHSENSRLGSLARFKKVL